MALILLLISVILVGFAVTYAAFWAGARLSGVRTTFKGILRPVLGVCLIEAVPGGLSRLSSNAALNGFFVLLSLVAGFLVWHYLLQKRYPVSRARAIGSFMAGTIIAWVALVILAFSTIGYVQSYRITGESMSPSLHDGDTVLVLKHSRTLHKGDVVVYHYKRVNMSLENPATGQALGRVKGLPGETVRPGTTYFNPDGLSVESASYTLKSNEYYIIADNEEVSLGSIVRPESIVGKVGPTIQQAR